MRLSGGAVNDLQVATLWDAYSRMKFDAATLSSEDLPDLEGLPPAAKSILVCANVTYQMGTPEQIGKPIAPPVIYRTVKTASGQTVKIAIIGILGDPPYQTVPNPANSPADKPWKVSSPLETLRTLVPQARSRANIIVVMYSGTRDPARKLMQAIAGIDVMVVGLEGSVDHRAENVGNGVLVQNAERGRYGGQLGITLDKYNRPTAWDLRSITLDDGFKDDPAMVALLKEFHDKQTRIAPAPVTYAPAAAPPKSDWAGSYMCASCHADEFNQWRNTKHFIAMATLEKQDGGQPAKRADCVGCHVVAYDKPGGYTLASPSPRWDLKGVGCEACHGPAAGHVDARLKKMEDTSKLVANPGKDVCITCHTKDNSPNFDFATYHKKIAHKAAVASAPVGGAKAAGSL